MDAPASPFSTTSELAFVAPDNEWIIEPGSFRIEFGGLSEEFGAVGMAETSNGVD